MPHKDINDKIAYDKLYRDAKREYRYEKIQCECGSCYSRNNQSQHFKTNKHTNYKLPAKRNEAMTQEYNAEQKFSTIQSFEEMKTN